MDRCFQAEIDEEAMRVLIVDDEPLAQTALANILSARSDVEHFDSANDASEALEKLATGGKGTAYLSPRNYGK
jgi:CheY-like chemotaxis protein